MSCSTDPPKNWSHLPVEMQRKVLEAADFLSRQNFRGCSTGSAMLVDSMAHNQIDLLRVEIIGDRMKLSVHQGNFCSSIVLEIAPRVLTHIFNDTLSIGTLFIVIPNDLKYPLDQILKLKPTQVDKFILSGSSSVHSFFPKSWHCKQRSPQFLTRNWTVDESNGSWDVWKDMGGAKSYMVSRWNSSVYQNEHITAQIQKGLTCFLATRPNSPNIRQIYFLPGVHLPNPERTLEFLPGVFERIGEFCTKKVPLDRGKVMIVRVSRCGLFVGFEDPKSSRTVDDNVITLICGLEFMCPNGCYGNSVEDSVFRKGISSLH